MNPCYWCENAYAVFECCNREWCEKCYKLHEAEMHSCPGCGKIQDDRTECADCWGCGWCGKGGDVHPACILAIHQHSCYNKECDEYKTVFVDEEPMAPCPECGESLGSEQERDC